MCTLDPTEHGPSPLRCRQWRRDTILRHIRDLDTMGELEMGSREACQKTTWKQRVAVISSIGGIRLFSYLWERGQACVPGPGDNSNVGGEWENGGGAIWCISEQWAPPGTGHQVCRVPGKTNVRWEHLFCTSLKLLSINLDPRPFCHPRNWWYLFFSTNLQNINTIQLSKT